MGFVFDDALMPAEPAKKPGIKRIKPKEALSAERGCENCALRAVWPRITSARMPMYAPRHADILVLGEAPGEEEDAEGRPFVGASGKLLRNTMPFRDQDRLAFQNTVRCRPTDNETPSRAEAHACSLHLDADIATLRPKAIIGVGGVPLARFIAPGVASIMLVHGTKFPVEIGDHVCWYYPVFHPSFVLRLGGESGPAMPVLRSDLKEFFRDVDTWPKPRIMRFAEDQVTIITNEADALAAVDRLEEFYGFDIETSCLRPYLPDARVITAAFADRKQAFAFAVDHPEQRNEWAWRVIEYAINNKRRTWVAHNTGMELSWLWWRFGFEWAPTAYEDTMAFARSYHNRETLLSLAVQSRIHLGTNVKELSDINAAQIMTYPLAKVLPYNGLDARATILVWHHLAEHFERSIKGRLNVERILLTQRSIVAMELAGLPADITEARELSTLFAEKAVTAQREAGKIYEVREFERRTQLEFNIANPDHVGRALAEIAKIPLPRTEKGKSYSTDDQILQQYVNDSPLIRHALDYREFTKLDSTYVKPIVDRRYHGVDDFIHPGYTSMLVATLRLSSEDPNIQNWPKRKHKEVRRIVKAIINEMRRTSKWLPVGDRPCVFVAFDYGQLEARIIAMMSRCAAYCKAIIDGYDIHGRKRDQLAERWPEYLDVVATKSGETDKKKIFKSARDYIKNDFVFLTLFGGSAKTAAERIGAPLLIMQDMQNELLREFPGIKAWLRQRRGEYIYTGSCTMMTGRQRHAMMPGNEMINNPIQGSAADIVLEAMNALVQISIDERDPYMMPRINIHDDLSFFLPCDDEDELYGRIERIAEEMVKPRFDWITVPLVVEVSVGASWADIEEITKFTGAYHR